uniref:Kazal-like domain-containing protein n=1 Tax=Arion vulgaris TaxID=1028688 RepID=A0A0B7AQU4_9EUPU
MANLLAMRTSALSRLTLVAAVLLVSGFTVPVKASYNFNRCGECDETRCPELHYCEGQAIKDHCGCCTVCSSSKFQPHIMIEQQAEGNACDQVKCPKLKVCVVNMQGLPLCTCPNMFVCRGIKKREICGTDGRTYPSRCHMRIASCDEGVPVRKKYKGPCSEKSMEPIGASDRNTVKKNKKKRRLEENEAGAEGTQQKRKKKDKKRKRRKSGKNRGKSRERRHRGKHHDAGKTFEETFSDYTWNA